tara:strand:+ start:113 stop:325 length:213 start_codon:yes stop_codon:yes gene_type:complete
MKNIFAILLLGLVDSVESDYVVAEINNPQGNITQVEIPASLFPCDISEGDMFHIVKINGVTEIRCGEPDV